jgi:glycine/D-amino acid oxidase-like deaminating enzyme
VAAGVINPVTGRWMTKTWNADKILPVAARTYREIETALGVEVYHPIPEIRFCQNVEDVKRVARRMRNPRYQDVLGAFLEPGDTSSQFNDAYGAFEIKGAAYVDLPRLVESLRSELKKRDLFRDEVFRHDALEQGEDGWGYGEIHAERVVFCEGAATLENPWFKHVALRPVKGETLLCQNEQLDLDGTLYQHKKWLLPYSNGRFRVGASYDEDDLNAEPTAAKQKELLEAVAIAVKTHHSPKVVEHLAGIRPTTADSRPIIGAHPTEAGLYILNGLGSKGASTGPAMVEALAAHLIEGTPIDPEVCISRF